MSASFRSVVKKWSAVRSGDPYVTVSAFVESASSDLWPYAIILDQIAAGWSEDVRGALALNLAKQYKPVAHAVAAFIVLNGPWPASNATTAINLLTLAHRVSPTGHDALDRFVSRAALRSVRRGLSDASQVVAEESANILGGLGPHHFSAAPEHKISDIRASAKKVVDGIDDEDVSEFLRGRVDAVLADAKASTALGESDAEIMLKEVEFFWSYFGNSDLANVTTLKDHVTAFAWQAASATGGAVQVVHVDYPEEEPDKALSAWGIIGRWIAVVRDLLDTDLNKHLEPLIFAPVNATGGSLVVTLRIEAGGNTSDVIVKRLRDAKNSPLSTVSAEELSDALRAHGLRIHVVHVEADLSSASLKVEPMTGVARVPMRSRKLTTSEIPQANEWDRIFAVVDAVAETGIVMPENIGVTTPRQVQYYKAAARILGLLAPTDELTRTGWLLHVATGDERNSRARAAFEASPCGQAWIEWSGGTSLGDVQSNSARDFLEERSELTGDTVPRRANTLEMWLKALRP